MLLYTIYRTYSRQDIDGDLVTSKVIELVTLDRELANYYRKLEFLVEEKELAEKLPNFRYIKMGYCNNIYGYWDRKLDKRMSKELISNINELFEE